jgi:S1-C subfamily serine protease
LNSIHVILPDGRRLPAKLIGYDDSQDLAMLKLKVQAAGLTPVRFPQTAPELSTEVITVGRSPEPTRFTMTRGIISAVGRLNGSTLQIDAATNYANSGGPVVDADGHCVGLVAHVNPDVIWGQNSGIGFAVAGPTIGRDLSALMAGRNVERVKRGFMGVSMAQGRVDVVGVPLGQVQAGGPADRAGLKNGDVITEMDGRPVADTAELQNQIAACKPGQTIHLTVRRGDKTLSIDVVLDERPY